MSAKCRRKMCSVPQKQPAARVHRWAPSGTALPGAKEAEESVMERRVDWLKGLVRRVMKLGR